MLCNTCRSEAARLTMCRGMRGCKETGRKAHFICSLTRASSEAMSFVASHGCWGSTPLVESKNLNEPITETRDIPKNKKERCERKRGQNQARSTSVSATKEVERAEERTVRERRSTHTP